jgi:hypothetical protein
MYLLISRSIVLWGAQKVHSWNNVKRKQAPAAPLPSYPEIAFGLPTKGFQTRIDGLLKDQDL